MSSTKPTASNAMSLPDVVYSSVREAILNGMFTPGQMLRQEEVASKLGVSRSPLREALPRLEAEGIVVLHPRRGYAVASLDEKEIAEAFDLRALLETELARRSIEKRSDTDIAHVYAISGQMAVLAEDADRADRGDWFELNTLFHDALLSPADCKHHMRALHNSRGLIEAYIRTEVKLTGDLRQAQEEHTELAKCFVLGEADRFVALIRDHSLHTRERLLSGLFPPVSSQ